MARGDKILELVWPVILERQDGLIVGGIKVYRGENAIPAEFQASEEELFRLARALQETAREVKRLRVAKKIEK